MAQKHSNDLTSRWPRPSSPNATRPCSPLVIRGVCGLFVASDAACMRAGGCFDEASFYARSRCLCTFHIISAQSLATAQLQALDYLGEKQKKNHSTTYHRLLCWRLWWPLYLESLCGLFVEHAYTYCSDIVVNHPKTCQMPR